MFKLSKVVSNVKNMNRNILHWTSIKSVKRSKFRHNNNLRTLTSVLKRKENLSKVPFNREMLVTEAFQVLQAFFCRVNLLDWSTSSIPLSSLDVSISKPERNQVSAICIPSRDVMRRLYNAQLTKCPSRRKRF